MKQTCSVLLTLAAIILGLGEATAAEKTGLDESRSTLEKWVEARQQISRNKADWLNDKETIAASITLFESEITSLDALRETVRTNHTSVVTELSELESEKASLIQASEKMKGIAEKLEGEIQALTKALPEPLLEKLEQSIRLIPGATNETKLSVSQRMQNIVGILNEVEKFNAQITMVPEVQATPDGAEIQVTKIYIGLGQAYFVNEDATYAGVGAPSLSGWEWTTRNELARAVARVKAIYESVEPAAFVALPLEIK